MYVYMYVYLGNLSCVGSSSIESKSNRNRNQVPSNRIERIESKSALHRGYYPHLLQFVLKYVTNQIAKLEKEMYVNFLRV